MDPTGRSIDLEKIRKKLEEAKTLEERRLVLECVWKYVEDLRERRSQLYTELRGYLYALYVTVPLSFVSLLITLLHDYSLSIPLVKFMVATFYVITLTLAIVFTAKTRELALLEEEISQIYDLVLDPNMPRTNYWIYLVVVGILTALATVALILAWTL